MPVLACIFHVQIAAGFKIAGVFILGLGICDRHRVACNDFFAKEKYILKSAHRLIIGFRDYIIARAKLKFGGIFLDSFG